MQGWARKATAEPRFAQRLRARLIGFPLATNMSIASLGLPTPPLLSLTVSHSPVTLRPLSGPSLSQSHRIHQHLTAEL